MSKKPILWAVGLVLVIGAIVTMKPLIHGWDRSVPTNLNAVSGYDQATVTLSGTKINVQIPTTVALQEQGLAGRTTLSDKQGMLWLYSQPDRYTFWMKGMLIPLDFVWIEQGHIVDLTPNVPPPAKGQLYFPIYRPVSPVTAILEVRSGFIGDHGLSTGQAVSIDKK
ncbi:MAG: DUF192 domain-containing protein [Candidatus Kerfeldbacteria bacterium]|nr:DUF192 domain-containing protein [Candidatus Kerfeldbacteria bacterium]